MPRIIAYARVSTEDQATHGVSLDAQRTRLAAYCAAHELDVVAVVSDDGVSGKSMSGRGGLQQVLASLRAGEADGLVVAKLDRLSRSVRDVLDLVDEAGRRGWQLHSIAEHLDTSTASGRFTLTVLAGLAQMEREQVAERTRAALAHLRSQGKRTSGRAPFGYRFEAGHEVEAPAERPALARILELRADGLGPRRLARVLAAEQVANPRTGRAFTPGTLQAIVRTAERRARA